MLVSVYSICVASTLNKPGQLDIFICNFMNEMFCIPIQISLQFVPKGWIENKSASVQVMAWRRTSDKPLPEPMLTQLTVACMRH